MPKERLPNCIKRRGRVKGAETIQIPALATLLYADWIPQANGPPPALPSTAVDHKSCANINKTQVAEPSLPAQPLSDALVVSAGLRDVAGHHAPDEAGELPRDGHLGNVVPGTQGDAVEFPLEAIVCPVRVSNHFGRA